MPDGRAKCPAVFFLAECAALYVSGIGTQAGHEKDTHIDLSRSDVPGHNTFSVIPARQGQKEKLEDGERRTRVSKRVAQEGDRGLHACLCCHLFTPPARLSPASFLRRQES